MGNRYLERTRFTVPPWVPGVVAVFGVLVGLGSVIVWPMLPLGTALVVTAGILTTRISRAPSSTATPRLLVESEQIEEAEALLFRMLSQDVPPFMRTELFLMLGRCAERAGDFGDAVEVFRTALGDADETQREELLDRIAFCEAASGSAAATLDHARSPESAHSSTSATPAYRKSARALRPLELRAQVLAAYRRGDHGAVLALVADADPSVRTELPLRDVELVDVLAFAARPMDPNSPGDLPPVGLVSLSWVEKAAPEVRATLSALAERRRP